MKYLQCAAFAFLMAISVGSSSVFAHDGPHAGSSMEATVVSLKGNVLIVKTDAAEVNVTLGAKTQILFASKTVGPEALLPGVHVEVHGSKLPGGGFAAKEITIEGAPGAAPHADHEP